MTSLINKINKWLVIAWLLIVTVLFTTYCGEVAKGERTLLYLIIFTLVTAVPAVCALVLFLRNQSSEKLQYFIVIGYSVMYIFTMVTGSTFLVFVYILPMLSFLILYHNPKLILGTGAASLAVNVIAIAGRAMHHDITKQNSKDVEIQIALLVLCFLGSYIAAQIYDEITRQNTEYLREVSEKNAQIQNMTFQTITTVANTIDAKDEYTKGHSKRVSEYSAAIARELGLDEEKVQEIKSVALLHDIGKIGVPDYVLNKPGRLTTEEYTIMKHHTVVGAEILKDIGMIPGIDIGAKYHHERYDGFGYPEGLKGEEIPFIARIISVADAYDAMTTNRVYRAHLSDEVVMQELKKGIGKQFDPDAVNALIRLIEEKNFKVIEDTETSEVMDVTTIWSRVMEMRDAQNSNKLVLDELTGSYNRSYGERVIREAMMDKKGCMALVDIDHFRDINVMSGYVSGDVYLKVVVDTIRSMSKDVIIARFGGDEFALFSQKVTTEEAAEALAETFMEKLRERTRGRKELGGLAVSVGIALVDEGCSTFDQIFIRADRALYHAKKQGGDQYYCHRQDTGEMGQKRTEEGLNQLISFMKKTNDFVGELQELYPEFTNSFQAILQTVEENGKQVKLALFSILPGPGRKLMVEERDRILSLLDGAIRKIMPKSDVAVKYSSNQYAVLFADFDMERAKEASEMIAEEFLRQYEDTQAQLQYDIVDLSERI